MSVIVSVKGCPIRTALAETSRFNQVKRRQMTRPISDEWTRFITDGTNPLTIADEVPVRRRASSNRAESAVMAHLLP